MKDEDKTKAQLIEELQDLRKKHDTTRQFSAEGKPGAELFKSIVENASDAIVTIDTKGSIAYFNRKAEEMFGYTAAEILGKSSRLLLPESMKDEEIRSVIKHSTSKRNGYLASLTEGLALCKNGSLLPIEASYYGYHLDDRYWMTGIIRDISERIKVEKALKETRDSLDNIIESSVDSIVITNATGIITQINGAFLRLLGLEKKEQIIGQRMEAFYPYHEAEYETTTGEHIQIGRNYFQAMQGAIARLQEGNNIPLLENYHLRADNRIVPVEDTFSPLFDKNGALIGAVGIIRDITERKMAEKQVAESRDFLKQLFDIGLEGLIVSDAQGQITMVNDRLAIMLRYSKNDLIGKTLGIFTPAPEKESGRKLMEELRSRGSLCGIERTWMRGDGSYIDVELNVSLARDARGNITGAFSSIRDVSERKKADLAVRTSEERYRRIFESSFISLQELEISRFMACINDLKSQGMRDIRHYLQVHPEFVWKAISMAQIIDINDATLKMYGAKNKEELIASTDKLFCEESPALREGLIALAEGKSSFQAESVHHTLQGGDINVLLQINFLAKQRDLNRILVSIIDITKVKSAETKLLEYQEQLRSLTNELLTKEENERQKLGMYLHDRIGQSLSALKMQLSMLASESTAADDREKFDRLLQQINDTIHDTRVLSYELSPIILHELGLEVALGWLAEQTQKQHNMAVSFKSDKKAKQLDESLKIIVYRAVSELLNNVVKHAKADNAAVSIKGKNGQLQITVEDNGIGFDPAEIEGIAGTERGFGLFSIRERLHYLGGSVYIKSAPHKGTRITLLAPLKDSSRSLSGLVV